MCKSAVLRAFILKKSNCQTADVIELDFTKFEKRTVKIFLDGLYGIGTEDVDTEDLLKLLRLADQHGTDKDRDFNRTSD